MSLPSPPPGEWRIHVGAHKTATTHLQDTLQASRAELLAAGVDYMPLDILRPILLRTVSRRRWQYWTLGAPMRRALDAALAPARQDAPRVVLSEENLLGFVQETFSVPPYPRLDRHLAALNTLAADRSLTIYLSIRSFDRIVPGAYATALRSAIATPDDLATALAAFCRARPPSWVDVLRRVRRAMPGARLQVWRQDDYAGDARAILAEFVGLPGFAPPVLSSPALTVTPSEPAMREIEAVARSWQQKPQRSERKHWAKRFEEICAAHPIGPDARRFNPLDAASLARLQARYAEDCAEIAATWPEICLLWGRA